MLEWGREALASPWLWVVSLVMFVGCLAALPVVVARIPADYFLHRRPPEESWRAQYPFVRFVLRAIKNVAGGLFVLAGVAMLVRVWLH